MASSYQKCDRIRQNAFRGGSGANGEDMPDIVYEVLGGSDLSGEGMVARKGPGIMSGAGCGAYDR